MPQSGQWTHNGSVEGLRRLAIRTKETGDKGLMARTRRELNKAAQPAREAVTAMERAVLPKSGGLNEWVANTPVKVSVLTGPKTAGVRLRQSKKGRAKPHDLRRMDEYGVVRHPVFGRRTNPQDWQTTAIPTGWWEAALLPTRVQVTTAMLGVLHEAGYEAGFR